MSDDSPLRRTISLPLLTAYGLGTILGAGIYVLVGEVAGTAGMLAPFSFLLAAIIAGFTAFTFAELSSRIPRSGGEATYVHAAFGNRFLAGIAGWGIVATGVNSSATITRGFVGYLEVFVSLPEIWVIIGTLLFMGLLAAWGVRESVLVASVITCLEVLGLLLVIGLAGHHLGNLPQRWAEVAPTLSLSDMGSIFLGSYLAFFAFIGFEDMVNMAEEVKRPERNLPRAILVCLVVSTFLYFAVALVATMALPPAELSGAKAPLARVLAERGPWAETLISIISMLAVINGALVQILMAARVLYGMGRSGIAPRVFARVHPVTRTPVFSTAFITIVIIVLAVGLPLVVLAKATTTVILMVFALVNVALVRIKLRDGVDACAVNYPFFVPVIGFFLCLGCLLLNVTRVLGIW